MRVKWPWSLCPDTYVDPAAGVTCERAATAVNTNFLVYYEYTCHYQCAGPPPFTTSYSRKRVLFIFDFDD